MKFQKTFAVLVGFASALAFTACSRSQGYEKDQTYYDEMGGYYGDGVSPTQRIQAMGQPKKRVVVMGFWNDTPADYNELGPFAADELRRGLFATQRMILPPQDDARLDTKYFVQGEKVKVGQLIREGRRLGVAVIVIGRIDKLVFRQKGDQVGLLRQTQSLAGVDVEIKVFDVASGREVSTAGRSGQSSSNKMVAIEKADLESKDFRQELAKLAVRDAVVQMVPIVVKSVEKMAWEGRVAKIVGTKVYVNAGRSSGLVGGDILKILTPGEDIYDPVTGALLGRTKGQLKGTVEVTEFVGTDGAAGNIHTGGNFAEGDVVRLY